MLLIEQNGIDDALGLPEMRSDEMLYFIFISATSQFYFSRCPLSTVSFKYFTVVRCTFRRRPALDILA